MSKGESSFTKLAIAVAGPLIVGLITYLLGFWPAIWDAVKTIFTFLWSWSFGPHPIPGWLLLVFLACFLVCLLQFVLLFFKKTPQAPDFTDYWTDEFFGMRWRWEFHGLKVGEPFPFCPRCDTQFAYPEEGHMSCQGTYCFAARYRCDGCRFEATLPGECFSDTQNKVVRLVQKKLRSGEWERVVEFQKNNPPTA